MIQPLVNPLYDGVSEHELFAALLGENSESEQIVKDYWKDKLGLDFNSAWRRALHDGFVSGTAFAPKLFLRQAF